MKRIAGENDAGKLITGGPKRLLRAFLLAAALCAAAACAAGCGGGKAAEEAQEVPWKTTEQKGETDDMEEETEAPAQLEPETTAAPSESVPAQSAPEALEYPFTERVSALEAEDMVKAVRASWTRDREAIEAGRYDKHTENGMDVYRNGGEIVMIEVGAGNGGNPYSATYEFENGKMIFAFYVGEGKEYRLYYHNDSLFRLNMRVDGKETIKDADYEDDDFIQWQKIGLYAGYFLYQLAEGNVSGAGAAVETEAGTAAAAEDGDFKFKTAYQGALGNGEAYLLRTFGDPEDTYYGDQGEVMDTNWYTFQNPYCFFELRRSADAVFGMISNAGTVFEMSKASYSIEEVQALLGASDGYTYEGESVEGSFSETGDMVFSCSDQSLEYSFIMENGRVTKESICEIIILR